MAADADTTKPRVFSGIQPTGRKTLGNYSGGFRQYAQTQETHDGFFCIVDLHSITVEYDPQELRDSTLDLAAMLFATGLDPERSIVFCQSHVTAHSEAAWLLSAVASYGQLGRMTQFKEKSDRHEFVSAGLFTYPVLMAGDILLYQTDLVPIGDDQRQHLELARDIAERFNYRYGETFTVPDGKFPEVGGADHGPAGSDEQDVDDALVRAGRRLPDRRARRDPQEVQVRRDRLGPRGSLRPGGEARRVEPARDHERRHRRADRRAREELRRRGLRRLQGGRRRGGRRASRHRSSERFEALRADERELQRLLAVGAEKARRASEPTLEAMYDRMGFVKAEAGRLFGAARPRGL